jgi:Derlin-2/3
MRLVIILLLLSFGTSNLLGLRSAALSNGFLRQNGLAVPSISATRRSQLVLLRGGKSPKSKSSTKRKKVLKESSIKDIPSDDIDFEENFGKDKQIIRSQNYIFTVVKQFFTRTPPITLFYLTTSITITCLSFFLNQNRWPSVLSFSWKDILLHFHFWKLFTGFFYLGSMDIFYPLTLQFIYQNMAQLEKLFCKNPEEFLFLILFGCTSLIGVYSVFGLPTNMLGHNLGSYLLYLWSKFFEGMDVNFMDLFVIKSEVLPFFFCLQSLLLEQQIPYGDLIGIFVGFVYYLLKQRGLIFIPSGFKNLFQMKFLKGRYEKLKEEFEV